MILHRTLLMYIMTSVTTQAASSTAVKKSQEYTKGILYVLPPVFYYVIEVLPNSEILIVWRGQFSVRFGSKTQKAWNHPVKIN